MVHRMPTFKQKIAPRETEWKGSHAHPPQLYPPRLLLRRQPLTMPEDIAAHFPCPLHFNFGSCQLSLYFRMRKG